MASLIDASSAFYSFSDHEGVVIPCGTSHMLEMLSSLYHSVCDPDGKMLGPAQNSPSRLSPCCSSGSLHLGLPLG